MPIDFLADDFISNKSQPQSMGRDFLQEEMPQREDLKTAAMYAIPRIATDIGKGAYQFAQNIPDYLSKGTSEVPAALNLIKNNPARAGKQALAGVSELGQNVFNTPHDLINYFSQRLNLVPENINKMVQMGRMPSDTQNAINQTFGEAKEPGEALIRGLPRNALNILGGAGAAKVLNPMRFSSGGIAKNILKEEAKQISSHTNRYNNIWKQADKSGFNQVPVDRNILNKNLSVIEKYKTPKEFNALKEFIQNPTLEMAQRAQSDMGVISRALEKKSRTSALLSEEKAIYDAAKEAEKHIEGNMFKNGIGETNAKLKNQYDKLTNSYRENVVPYRYHPAIQAFKNKEMTAPELVNALSRGSFAAKKGSKHPALKVNKLLNPVTLLGTGGLLGYLYNDLTGTKANPAQPQR
jgi:hypothetical protein